MALASKRVPMNIEVDEPAGLMEQVGVAVNTKSLTVDPAHERAVDKVAALGMSAGAVSRERNRFQDRNQIEARLSPLLWTVKAGDQHGHDLRMSILFARWLLIAGKFQPDQLEICASFAVRVIDEWRDERCRACRGCGRQEQTAAGWNAPRGGIRNPVLRCCAGCGGSGQRKGNKHERAACLGLQLEPYLTGGWERKFRLGQIWLKDIARRVDDHLHSKLRQSSIRA